MTNQTKFAPVLAVVEQMKANYQAYIARIEAAYSEANNGQEPTRDSLGRFHAPCDGYMLPDGWAMECEGDYCGRLFGRGEYLPVPVTNAEHEENRYYANMARPLYDYRQKVKALVSDIADFKALGLHGIEVNTGKAWTDDNGNATAYAYLEGKRSLVDAAVNNLGELYSATKVKGPEVYVEGRVSVIGIIVAVKPHHDPMYGNSLKMLVSTAEGARLWGTMPSALPYESQGKQVSFTATFTKGKGGMSYFKRPACAVIVGE